MKNKIHFSTSETIFWVPKDKRKFLMTLFHHKSINNYFTQIILSADALDSFHANKILADLDHQNIRPKGKVKYPDWPDRPNKYKIFNRFFLLVSNNVPTSG